MQIFESIIKRPVTVIMCMLIVVVLGLFSLMRVPVDLFPNLNIPVAVVSTNYVGAGPLEVENLVTRRMESVMTTVTNISSITSRTFEGSSLVIVQFNDGTDMNFATLEMREKVDLIKDTLPDGATEPIIIKIDPNNLIPIMQLGVTAEGMDGIALKEFVEDKISTRLERIFGVASVNVVGGEEREIVLDVDSSKLKTYGVSLTQVENTLRGENQNLPGGSVQYGNRDLNVKTKGEFQSIQDIANIPMVLPQGQILYIRDVANLTDTVKDAPTVNRINGQNNIGLVLQKQTDANTVNVVRTVKKEIAKLEKEYPQIQIKLIFDQAKIIEKSIQNVRNNALFGAILAIFILLLFLKSFRTTFIIGIAIPVSIISTFILMFLNDTSLNLISMGGLALGVGMMVDSSIVVIENIYRKRKQGKSAFEAASEGTKQVAGAVIASTLTTVVVFVPIIFTEGWAADLFKQMALTVTFSLLSSLIVSLTVIPMLSSKILKTDNYMIEYKGLLGMIFAKWDQLFQKIENFYVRVLGVALKKRIKTLLVGFLIFIVSIAAIVFVGFEFLPSQDEGSFSVTIDMPDGTLLEDTDKVVRSVEKVIAGYADVEQWFVTVGDGGENSFAGVANQNRASITVTLVERTLRNLQTADVVESIREKLQGIPGAKIEVNIVDSLFGGGGPGGGAPITIEILGYNFEALEKASRQVVDVVNDVDGTRQVKSSLSEGIPEVAVYVDRDKASVYGVSAITVASNLRTALQGQVVTKYRVDGEEIDVRVQFPEEQRQSIEKVKSILISAPGEKNITLGEVARVEQELGPLEIERKNQTRVVTVTSQLYGRTPGGVVSEIQTNLENMNLPEGVSVQFGGQNEEMMSAFRSLGLALLLSVLLIYMVMASQFESLLQPFIIMFAVPLAFSGAALGLGITGRSFNVATFIGIIMLGGIVVNNAIILVDYINQLRRGGVARTDAITRSVSVRLRPIFMTTLTTVLGMFPLALGIGEGSEVQAPFATVIIFGLLFSTLLTLILVPVIYALLDDWRQKIWKIS